MDDNNNFETEDTVSAEHLFGKRETAEERRQRQKEEAAKIGEEGWPKYGYQTAEIITLGDALECFGFMSHGSQVIDLRNPKMVHGFSDWANLYAASKQPTTTPEGKTKLLPVATIWRDSINRKHAFSQTFKPGAGNTCEDPRGRVCFNKWRPIIRPAGDSSLAQPFVDHIGELFGEDSGRFLDWLAHIEQRPGELPHTGWLHIADQTGTGRNWVSSVLCRVWAGYVASNFDLSRTLKNGFNDRLEAKLLAQVDEIREGGGDMWAHHEDLKSMVNPEFREINPKYGRKHVEFNVCRWLIFSNSIMAIPLTDSDRRFEVVRHVGEPREEGYYSKLYVLLDNREFINAVALWLRNRDISQFNPGARAKKTSAKEALIEANKSDERRRVEVIIERWPIPWISSAQLRDILYDEDDSGVRRISKHAKITLRELGATPTPGPRRRLRNGELVDIWQIRTPDKGKTLEDAVSAIEAMYAGTNNRSAGHDWNALLVREPGGA